MRFIADENPRAARWRAWPRPFFGAQPEIVAAVTGTKGKSSIVAFLREIWTALGKPAASLGTVGVVGPQGRDRRCRTPRPIRWKFIACWRELKSDGVDHLAIEASSHGLDQYRLDGVDDRGRGFTNITRDHMDYHADLRGLPRRQAAAVHRSGADGGVAVVNADADHADAFIAAAQERAA